MYYIVEAQRREVMAKKYEGSPLENAGARPDPVRIRTGLTKCIYLSNRADIIVRALGARFRRSDSAILSLVMEKYGRGILKSPDVRL